VFPSTSNPSSSFIGSPMMHSCYQIFVYEDRVSHPIDPDPDKAIDKPAVRRQKGYTLQYLKRRCHFSGRSSPMCVPPFKIIVFRAGNWPYSPSNGVYSTDFPRYSGTWSRSDGDRRSESASVTPLDASPWLIWQAEPLFATQSP
jgi:hypothetical protein